LCARHCGQRNQFFLVEGGNDQQNGIGAIGAGFDDLEFVDDEILAQQGRELAAEAWRR